MRPPTSIEMHAEVPGTLHSILTVQTRSLPHGALAGEKRELLLVRSYQLLIYYTFVP
jgi:hypothetical protein